MLKQMFSYIFFVATLFLLSACPPIGDIPEEKFLRCVVELTTVWSIDHGLENTVSVLVKRATSSFRW